jgi:hypothetical protein
MNSRAVTVIAQETTGTSGDVRTGRNPSRRKDVNNSGDVINSRDARNSRTAAIDRSERKLLEIEGSTAAAESTVTTRTASNSRHNRNNMDKGDINRRDTINSRRKASADLQHQQGH